MRPPVDRRRIEEFLEALGREVGVPARVYLVGGTTVVWLGLRASTLDIDLAVEGGAAAHSAVIGAVRNLKERLDVNVEEVSPADFIPLPSGAETRAVWVGRFGRVDVFHYDLVASALSKIERGHESDLDDVEALLKSGHLKREELRKGYEEVLPRMGKESLKQDPERLKRNFEALEKRLGAI